jgi:hypothetical protein
MTEPTDLGAASRRPYKPISGRRCSGQASPTHNHELSKLREICCTMIARVVGDEADDREKTMLNGIEWGSRQKIQLTPISFPVEVHAPHFCDRPFLARRPAKRCRRCANAPVPQFRSANN